MKRKHRQYLEPFSLMLNYSVNILLGEFSDSSNEVGSQDFLQLGVIRLLQR